MTLASKKPRSAAPLFRTQRGVTLIELMVALAIGSFLMIGAVTVFMQGRTTFRVNESISRMQENGRFVIDAVEPDVRMAHYWGLTTRTAKIQGRATPAQPVPGALAVANDCGQNWTINLAREVNGTNNAYNWGCAPFGGAAQPNSDTLVIRRVTEDAIPAAALQAGTMYVQSARFQDGQIFVGNAVPAGFLPGTSETHQLMVSGYYVSPTSAVGPRVPSLRVKTLIGGAGGPQIVDQEVLPGVEDMQVQLGVDTDPVGAPNRGSIDRYVNVGDPMLDPTSGAFDPNAQVLAIRLWFRVRAENIEVGFTDTANYVYADQNVGPFNDSFRRTLISKTIYLRNARPPA
jgi:type IV pilus assembly protein PilW